MAEARTGRRTGMTVAAAVCALAVVLGGAVWVVGTGIGRAARWVEDALPDRSVTEATQRIEASAQAFADALQQMASVSFPTTVQVESAALAWDLTVVAIGSTPTVKDIWAVGVEREVPSEASTTDVWSCFDIAIHRSGPAAAWTELRWPEGGCRGPDIPESLGYAVQRLDHRDALARYGRQLRTAGPIAVAPLPPAGSVVDGLRILQTRVDGAAVEVDVADAAGTIVLGPPDSYLYGLRLTAGPDLAEDPRIAAVGLAPNLDQATRTRAETDAIALVESSREPPSPSRVMPNLGALDRRLGTLISVLRYEATDDATTVHVAVEVIAGGWGARSTDPTAPTVLVCLAIVDPVAPTPAPVRNIEQCAYPLLAAGPERG